MNELSMHLILPPDGGPIYAETDLSAFISEPWNALSSLAIALPSVYWAFKLKWNIKDYSFLYFLIPLLFLGGLGSTFYHASRTSELLLWMDVLPTAIVTFSVSVYFWNKILPRKWQVATVLLPITFIRFAIFEYLPGQLAMNTSYFITGFLIFFPIIFYLHERRYRHYKPILISVLFLSLSLVFRKFDFAFTELFPMGSHFLWHIFSGVGAFYLARFIYLIRQDELNSRLT